MKRLLSITIITLAALLSCGCQKTFLDKKAYDSIDGEYVLSTEKGMQLLLNGAYSELKSQNYYGALLYLYEASKGPDFFVRNVSGGYSFYTENRYQESSNLNSNAKSLWVTIYNVIRNCTLLIDNIDGVAGEVSNLRRIKGEAYALRGLAYFDLSRLYAYPPKFSCTWGSSYSDMFKWGVPIIRTAEVGTDIFDYEIMRETADDTWEYITDQFTLAYGLLKGTRADNGKIGPEAVLGLLTRVKLYMELYDDVIALGKEWIDNYESSYKILSYESYKTQYCKAFNSESIWEVKYTESDNLNGNSLNYWVRRPTIDMPDSPNDGKVSQNVGYGKLGLTYGASGRGLESLQSYSADVRQYLVCELGINGKDYHSVRKYVGDPYHFVHNVPVIRLPEIYFNMAEAYFKNGSTKDANDILTPLVQARRKANADFSSLETLLNERRREFVLEGQTYWDWFRNGRNISGRPIIESIGSSSTITFGSTSGLSYRTVYPIPLSEMNANPAIRPQKNPGYADWEFGVEDE